MGKTPTPPPVVRDNSYGCGLIIIAIPCLLVPLALLPGFEFMFPIVIVTSIPAVALIMYWLYGRILLWMSLCTLARRGIRGIIVYSSSPNWQEYIESNWLAAFGDRMLVLNWSERHRWSKTLPVRVYRHFCGYGDNYCPAILLFRGLLHPYVYRFFFAFRDYKHGNPKALKELESHLLNQLDIMPSSGFGGGTGL